MARARTFRVAVGSGIGRKKVGLSQERVHELVEALQEDGLPRKRFADCSRPNFGMRGNMDLAIETRNLVRHYGPLEALRGLNLHVTRNRVTGFLGRSGAGKSTTIRMLPGMTRRDSGTALGHAIEDPAARGVCGTRKSTAI